MALVNGQNNKFKCKINFPLFLNMDYYFESINKYDGKKNNEYKLICATLAEKQNGHTVAFFQTYYKNQYCIFNVNLLEK